MSKSLGNTLAPQVIAEKNGAEILRLWAASSDFTEDLRLGQYIIKANVEAYRRLRNTVRFMLANLSGFSEKERIDYARMPELERFMLARLAELDGIVRKAYENFDFGLVNSTLGIGPTIPSFDPALVGTLQAFVRATFPAMRLSWIKKPREGTHGSRLIDASLYGRNLETDGSELEGAMSPFDHRPYVTEYWF